MVESLLHWPKGWVKVWIPAIIFRISKIVENILTKRKNIDDFFERKWTEIGVVLRGDEARSIRGQE